MTYKMTPERAKALTEMIGEEYSEGLVGLPFEHECKTYSNRTFVTDEDMMKVFRWLVDEGKYEAFMTYAHEIWDRESDSKSRFIAWLFYDAERFNVLVAMALEEGVI